MPQRLQQRRRIGEERVDDLGDEVVAAELPQAVERRRVELCAVLARARPGHPERLHTLQGLRELVRTDRLGDVVVHPGSEAGFAILGQRVRGHRDDPGAGRRPPPWRRISACSISV